MRLGKLISLWRNLNNLTQKDLAADMGISKAALDRLEGGGHICQDSFVKVWVWLFNGLDR